MKYFTLVLFSALLTWAKPTNGPANEPPTFILTPTLNNERAYVLRTPAARYSFTLPHNWNMRVSPEEREVSLIDGDGGLIQMRFNDEKGRPASMSDPKKWLAELQNTYKGASLVDEPQLNALSRKVTALDLEWIHASVAPQSGRFVRVPLEKGFLEIALTTGREKFGENLPILMHLMLSLRAAGLDEAIQVRPSSPE